MRIGFVGLGKIGLPIAVCMAQRGHDVVGHDSDRSRMNKEPKPGLEGGEHGFGHFNDELAKSDIRFGTLGDVCDHAEIIFVAVQTPHGPEFEGVTPIAPGHRADFDYAWLRSVVSSLATLVSRKTTVAIISTVLPRTCRRELLPLCSEHMHLVYNPSFIAMGTTMFDFFNPEIVLCGADRAEDHEVVRRCYNTIVAGPPFFACSIETAELIKVAYHTFIGQNVIFANTLREIYYSLYNFAQQQGWSPRAQNVSVGVTVNGTRGDLVPGKVQAGYENYHSLYLRKRDSWTQTNVALHVDTVRKSGRVREIRAIKIWRFLRSLEWPSLYLELFTIRAVSGRSLSALADNVLHALRVIGSSLTSARIEDPANTNNVLSDDLSAQEKQQIASLAAQSARELHWERIIW